MPTFVVNARDTTYVAREDDMAIQAEPIIVGEIVPYTVDFSNRGTPSSPDAEVYEVGNPTELTGIVTTAASAVGDTVTCKITPAAGHGGKVYRLLLIGTISSEVNKQAIHIPIEAPEGA